VFDTFGSSFDTLLAIYSGNSVAALTTVASNNDLDNVTKQSRVSFTPVAGTTYYIAVDGFGGASGNFVLSWSQSGLGFLPDLVIRAGAAANYQITNLTFISTDCAVVEGLVQAGTRKLLVFTTETRNVGLIDWYEGNPANNPDFVWAPCHAHYHFNNYMLYQLLDNNSQPVAVGLKVGFVSRIRYAGMPRQRNPQISLRPAEIQKAGVTFTPIDRRPMGGRHRIARWKLHSADDRESAATNPGIRLQQ
jgi:hypothetical protein